MALIKTLKDFLTKNVIYPTTKTNAVYDNKVGRLDTYLENTLGAESIDDVDEEEVEIRDADTLGGRYTAEDLDAMPKSSAVEDYTNVEPPIVDADRLGGYTVNDIDDIVSNVSNISQNIDDITEKFKWKMLTNVTGYVEVQLPTTFNEIYIKCFDGTDYCQTLLVPRVALDDAKRFYSCTGGYFNVDYNGSDARYWINKTSVQLKYAYINGADKTSVANTTIYYR